MGAFKATQKIVLRPNRNSCNFIFNSESNLKYSIKVDKNRNKSLNSSISDDATNLKDTNLEMGFEGWTKGWTFHKKPIISNIKKTYIRKIKPYL